LIRKSEKRVDGNQQTKWWEKRGQHPVEKKRGKHEGQRRPLDENGMDQGREEQRKSCIGPWPIGSFGKKPCEGKGRRPKGTQKKTRREKFWRAFWTQQGREGARREVGPKCR